MAFKYKLEVLLRIRTNIEEQAQHKLAHEIFVLDKHKLFLAELRKSRQELIKSIEEKKKETLAASLYCFYWDSMQNQDRRIEFQINAVKAQEHLVEQVRLDLEKKAQERKIVERMKEKDHLEYIRETDRVERKELDELSVLRFGQRQRI